MEVYTKYQVTVAHAGNLFGKTLGLCGSRAQSVFNLNGADPSPDLILFYESTEDLSNYQNVYVFADKTEIPGAKCVSDEDIYDIVRMRYGPFQLCEYVCCAVYPDHVSVADHITHDRGLALLEAADLHKLVHKLMTTHDSDALLEKKITQGKVLRKMMAKVDGYTCTMRSAGRCSDLVFSLEHDDGGLFFRVEGDYEVLSKYCDEVYTNGTAYAELRAPNKLLDWI